MGSNEKRLSQMAANPRDWTIDDVESLCKAFGLGFRRGGGSHATVSHPSQADILTIPAKRPIKPIYIKRLVEFVNRVNEENGNGS